MPISTTDGMFPLIQALPHEVIPPLQDFQQQVEDAIQNGVVNVKASPYGAIGNGSVDDTAALRSALAIALALRRPLYIPTGNYRLSGSGGTEFLLVTKSIEIYGDGKRASRLVVDTGTVTTKDVIRVLPPATGSQPTTWLTPAALDNEGYYFHDFAIVAQSEPDVLTQPYPSQPARHAIHFDISTSGRYLMNSKFERLFLGAFSGKGMYFNNLSGGVAVNSDGFAQVEISSCDIRNGIKGDWWGDFIYIHHNDFVGQGPAIESKQVAGASNLTVAFNRNTSVGGAALFHNGMLINYIYNEDEAYILSSAGVDGAMVSFKGDLAQIEFVNYIGNKSHLHFVGASTPLDGVNVDNVLVFAEDHNRMAGMNGKFAFKTTTNTLNPIFGISSIIITNGTTFALTNSADPVPVYAVKTINVEPNISTPATFQPNWLGVDKIATKTLWVTCGSSEIGSLTGKGVNLFFDADAQVSSGVYSASGGAGAATLFPANRDSVIRLDLRLLGNRALLDFTGGVRVSSSASENSVALGVESTTGAFLSPRMTTTQRDALTATDGMVLYNTSTNKLQVRAAGAWVDLH